MSEYVDGPAPWRVVEVLLTDGTVEHHLTDADDRTLFRSRDVTGRGPELSRALLERVAQAINAANPEVFALARVVAKEDGRGVVSSTNRHYASSLLVDLILGLSKAHEPVEVEGDAIDAVKKEI
jgi:hypothetical protein